MGISVPFVMDGEVGNHAFGNKKLPAVVPDKVGVLFRGKFPRYGKHEDVYKRQALHDVKGLAVNKRLMLVLHHNPVLRLLFPDGADFEAVFLLLGSNSAGAVSYTHLPSAFFVREDFR